VTDPLAVGSVWLYSDDLIFTERVSSAAAARAIAFRRLGDADLRDLSSQKGLLIVDLEKGIDRIARAITHARHAGPNAWHICGYGSHVDLDGLRALRELGSDRVLSRASLMRDLELIIKESVTG
jgi:hypothetical protein